MPLALGGCMSGEVTAVQADDSRAAASSSRRPDIQGLRAIAVLVVVAFHAGLPVPGGFIGVDVFFVISGFVITGMLHREWSATGRLRFGRFYWRRFKRLTPALALLVAVVMVASALILSPLGPQQNAAKTGLGAMLLVANFVIARTTGGYFDAPAELNPLLNTWSLSVEEQFYLVFPALIGLGWYLARRRGPLRLSPFAIVGGIAIGSFTLAVLGSVGLTFRGSGTILGFYSPFTRAWEFAAGALLALALTRQAPRSRPIMAVSGLLGLIVLVVGLWTITETTAFPGPWTLLPVTATLLLLLAGTDPSTPTSRLLSTRPMVKVGDWSYSIYLWHWPIIVFAVLLWPNAPLVPMTAVLVSLAPALASYRWVEEPARHGNIVGAPKRVLLVTCVIAAPILISAIVGITARSLWVPRVPAMQMHAGYIEGCHWPSEFGDSDPAPCEWNSSSAGEPVYLLGDSNAAHYVEGLVDATAELKRPLIATTSSGCPLLDLRIVNPSDPGYAEACRQRTERLLNWMATQKPGTVVISSTDEYWLSKAYSVVLEDGTATDDEAAKISQMRDSLARTVRSLQAAGHEVLLLQTVPHFTGAFAWTPENCTLIASLQGCSKEMPLADAIAQSSAVRIVLDEVGKETGAPVYDFSGEICPEGTCSTVRDGLPVYRDGTHISVDMSHALAAALARLLQR